MRKNIIKVLSTLLIGCSLFAIPASAHNISLYCGTNSEKVVEESGQVYYKIKNSDSINAESYQWFKRDDNSWGCLTPDLLQGLSNMWVYTNGKWYYICECGKMVTNSIIEDKGIKYYLGSDGAITVNQYVVVGNVKYFADINGKLTYSDIIDIDKKSFNESENNVSSPWDEE